MVGYSHVVLELTAGLLALPAASIEPGAGPVTWVLMWGGAAAPSRSRPSRTLPRTCGSYPSGGVQGG